MKGMKDMKEITGDLPNEIRLRLSNDPSDPLNFFMSFMSFMSSFRTA
jgi:hypothetical protein